MRFHHSRYFATIRRYLGKGRLNIDLVSYRLFRVLVETLSAEDGYIVVVLDGSLNKLCDECYVAIRCPALGHLRPRVKPQGPP